MLVGNLPSTDGSGACIAESGPNQNVGQGSLLVIDKNGNLVNQLTDSRLLNGPWDVAGDRDDGRRAEVFVSNALSGTVTRLDLRIVGDGDGNKKDGVIVEKETQIASGYLHRCDPAADSGRCRSAFRAHADHLFRAMSISDSGGCRSPIPG